MLLHTNRQADSQSVCQTDRQAGRHCNEPQRYCWWIINNSGWSCCLFLMWNLTHSAGEFKNQMMSAPVFILLMFLLFGNLFCLPLNFSYFDIGGDKWPLKTMVTFSAFFVRFWSSLISVVDEIKKPKCLSESVYLSPSLTTPPLCFTLCVLLLSLSLFCSVCSAVT